MRKAVQTTTAARKVAAKVDRKVVAMADHNRVAWAAAMVVPAVLAKCMVDRADPVKCMAVDRADPVKCTVVDRDNGTVAAKCMLTVAAHPQAVIGIVAAAVCPATIAIVNML